MRKYRVVTALTEYGNPCFHVQYKDWLVWCTVIDTRYYNNHEREWSQQKDAESYILNRVAENEREAALKKQHKEFKSKVVYGPYPP